MVFTSSCVDSSVIGDVDRVLNFTTWLLSKVEVWSGGVVGSVVALAADRGRDATDFVWLFPGGNKRRVNMRAKLLHSAWISALIGARTSCKT